MLEALLEGQTDAAQMAELAKGKARRTLPELQAALAGHRLNDTLRFLIGQNLRHLEFLEGEIALLDEQIAERLKPFARQMELLTSLPGVDHSTGATILGGIGTDMTCFPSAKNLSSWAGLCPGNNERAGTQKGGRIRKGNGTLRSALNQCAWAAAHTKGTQLRARYEHRVPRCGKKRALVAVSHQMLVLIHCMFSADKLYSDPGWKPRLTGKKLKRRKNYHSRCLRD